MRQLFIARISFRLPTWTSSLSNLTSSCTLNNTHSPSRVAAMSLPRAAVPTLLLGALMLFTPPVQAVNGRPTSSGGVCDLSSTLEDSVSALRVAAIFIILVASALGVVLPFLPQLASSRSANNSKARRFWDECFFILKYVGAGVIVATAFVHLTYESFVELESPCINLTYKPLAPVLSMASLSIIFLVDCFLTRYLHRLRKKNRDRSSKREVDEEHQMSNLLILGQSAPGSITIPPRMTKEELERAEELERLEEEALDEKSKQMEVAIIEGGIVYVPSSACLMPTRNPNAIVLKTQLSLYIRGNRSWCQLGRRLRTILCRYYLSSILRRMR